MQMLIEIINTLSSPALALLFISLVLLFSSLIKEIFSVLKDYHIPSSIIAGFLGLALASFLPEKTFGFIQEAPKHLINIVFACIFLGRSFPSLKTFWNLAAPQAALGQIIAWGQYIIATLLTIIIFVPFFDASPLFAALLEISFQGGHGTAAGLTDVFRELGFADGRDLAIGMATVGLISGIIAGTIFINYAMRSNKFKLFKNVEKNVENEHSGSKSDAEEDRESSKNLGMTDQLSYQIAFITLAIFIGTLIYQVISHVKILSYMPIFPLAMIGGALLQFVLIKFKQEEIVKRNLIEHISGLALDLLIVSSLTTLSLSSIGDEILIFCILCFAGIAWNSFAFFVLAPRIIPKQWLEKALGDFGQSMGMTVTGLLLLKIVDPENRSQALNAFSYKQLFFEPIVGGGVFTAISMPLIDQLGLYWFLLIVTVIFAFWFYFGMVLIKKNK